MNIFILIKELLFDKDTEKKWDHFSAEEALKFAEELDRDFKEGTKKYF